MSSNKTPAQQSAHYHLPAAVAPRKPPSGKTQIARGHSAQLPPTRKRVYPIFGKFRSPTRETHNRTFVQRSENNSRSRRRVEISSFYVARELPADGARD